MMNATNAIVAGEIAWYKSRIEDFQNSLRANRERSADLYAQREAIEIELVDFQDNFIQLDPQSEEYANYLREEADLIMKYKEIDLDIDRLREEEVEYMKCIDYYEDELSKIEHYEIN